MKQRIQTALRASLVSYCENDLTSGTLRPHTEKQPVPRAKPTDQNLEDLLKSRAEA